MKKLLAVMCAGVALVACSKTNTTGGSNASAAMEASAPAVAASAPVVTAVAQQASAPAAVVASAPVASAAK